jgi:hypothetical protein
MIGIHPVDTIVLFKMLPPETPARSSAKNSSSGQNANVFALEKLQTTVMSRISIENDRRCDPI